MVAIRVLSYSWGLFANTRVKLASCMIRGEILVCGLSGRSAEDMAAGINSTLVDVCGISWKGLSRVLKEDGPFHLAILMAGTNDLPYPAKRQAAAANLLSLHSTCHSAGVPTLAIGVPPAPCANKSWRKHREILLRQMKQMSSFTGSTFIDPASLLCVEDKMLWDDDGLHFSQVGSVVLGKCLAQVVLEILQAPSCREARGLQLPAIPISRKQLAMKSSSQSQEIELFSIGRCLRLL